ncbi:2473_t:CDS:2, partial [Cetraspora pellucida]
DARGDQCDYYSKLLNSVELINPRCKTDNSTPITRKSNHMFIDLSRLQPKVENWIEKTSIKGLKPRCITRDLSWDTPVPLEEMKGKVFYIWFFASIGVFGDDAKDTGIPVSVWRYYLISCRPET